MADLTRHFEITGDENVSDLLEHIGTSFDDVTSRAEAMAARVSEVEELLSTRFKQNAAGQWIDTLGKKMTYAGSQVRDLTTELKGLNEGLAVATVEVESQLSRWVAAFDRTRAQAEQPLAFNFEKYNAAVTPYSEQQASLQETLAQRQASLDAEAARSAAEANALFQRANDLWAQRAVEERSALETQRQIEETAATQAAGSDMISRLAAERDARAQAAQEADTLAQRQSSLDAAAAQSAADANSLFDRANTLWAERWADEQRALDVQNQINVALERQRDLAAQNAADTRVGRFIPAVRPPPPPVEESLGIPSSAEQDRLAEISLQETLAREPSLLRNNLSYVEEYYGSWDASIQRTYAQIQNLINQALHIQETFNSADPGTFSAKFDSAIQSSLNSLDRLSLATQQAYQRIANPPDTASGTSHALQQLGTAEQDMTDRTEKARLALEQLNNSMEASRSAGSGAEASLRGVDTELKEKPGDANKAYESIKRVLEYAAGNMLQQILMNIGQELRNVAGQAAQASANQEGYLATFTSLLGGLEPAYQRLAQIRQDSFNQPVPVDDMISANRRLQAVLTDGATAEQRYGRSLQDVDKVLADVASARPDVSFLQVSQAIERIAVGAPRAGQSIRLLGLSAADLAAQGAQLNKQGSQLVGDTATNTAAVLAALEAKYHDMAALHSQTVAGMLTELGNWMQSAETILGADVFAEFRTKLREVMDYLERPETLTFLEHMATTLGKIAYVGFQAFDAVGKGLQFVWQWLGPVASGIGQILADLTGVSNLPPIQDPLAGFKDVPYTAPPDDGSDPTDPTQQNAHQIEELQNQIKGLRDQAKSVTAEYQAQIDPLKAQETELDRIYEKTNKLQSLGDAQRKLARDKALAVDIYSSEGRSAAERLPDDERAVENLQRDIAHTDTKNALQDKINAKQAEQQNILQGISDKEQQLQDRITAMQQAQTDWYNTTTTTTNKVNSALDWLNQMDAQRTQDELIRQAQEQQALSQTGDAGTVMGGQLGAALDLVNGKIGENRQSILDLEKGMINFKYDTLNVLGTIGYAWGSLTQFIESSARIAGDTWALVIDGIKGGLLTLKQLTGTDQEKADAQKQVAANEADIHAKLADIAGASDKFDVASFLSGKEMNALYALTDYQRNKELATLPGSPPYYGSSPQFDAQGNRIYQSPYSPAAPTGTQPPTASGGPGSVGSGGNFTTPGGVGAGGHFNGGYTRPSPTDPNTKWIQNKDGSWSQVVSNSAASGVGTSTTNPTLTIVMQDPNGKQWFVDKLEANKETLDAIIARTVSGGMR